MLIAVLHGVNLNMFGRRDPAHYGHVTLDEINSRLEQDAHELGCELSFFQTNHEGAMIDHIHSILDTDCSGLVINAGAWTHYSHALADALDILPIPKVEVHMSNVHARESFRNVSVLARAVNGSIAGFGMDSYRLGLRAVAHLASAAVR